MVLSVEAKILMCILVALFSFFIGALIIGEERKAQWFRKRSKYSFFLRRGVLGEALHFGYPVTKEGYFVVVSILVAIGAICSIICYVF